MIKDAEQFADEDKKVRERVDAKNAFDGYLHSMRNSKQFGGMSPDDRRTAPGFMPQAQFLPGIGGGPRMMPPNAFPGAAPVAAHGGAPFTMPRGFGMPTGTMPGGLAYPAGGAMGPMFG